ncbi:hypothetical protein GF360_03470 [candidate division WWE3 bacterium]|nr:hypothetical protein [candidate division WWE3 bacterium]
MTAEVIRPTQDFSDILNIPKDELEDSVWRNFWGGLYAVREESPNIARLFQEALVNRNKFIPTSIANYRHLIPRPFNYLLLQEDLDIEIDRLSAIDWQKHIRRITTTKSRELSNLLETKTLAVFNSKRYLPILFLRDMLGFNTNRCADLGCSVNFGFTKLTQITPDAFDTIVNQLDHNTTPQPLDVPEYEIGFDYQQRDLLWTQACYFPQYIQHMRKKLGELEDVYQSQNNHFEAVDLTKNIVSQKPSLEEIIGTMDVVHASLVFYLLDEEGRKAFTDNALRLLKEGGAFIQTDMFDPDLKLDSARSVRTVVKFKESDYKFSHGLELIEYAHSATKDHGPSDSCNVWYPGKDWNELKKSVKNTE